MVLAFIAAIQGSPAIATSHAMTIVVISQRGSFALVFVISPNWFMKY